ncbi:hypothetical protein D3C85_1275900 [compost metagenome]
MHSLDIERGTGRLSLTLKDSSGRSVFASDEAYIMAFPESSFSNDFGNRVWRIFLQTSRTFDTNGNGDSITNLFNAAINEVASFF